VRFRVHDAKLMTELILPKYFRHTKLTSFMRQLNNYGFSKVKSLELDTPPDETFEFVHETDKFRPGRPDLLNQIIRRRNLKRMRASASANVASSLAGPIHVMTSDDAPGVKKVRSAAPPKPRAQPPPPVVAVRRGSVRAAAAMAMATIQQVENARNDDDDDNADDDDAAADDDDDDSSSAHPLNRAPVTRVVAAQQQPPQSIAALASVVRGDDDDDSKAALRQRIALLEQTVRTLANTEAVLLEKVLIAVHNQQTIADRLAILERHSGGAVAAAAIASTEPLRPVLSGDDLSTLLYRVRSTASQLPPLLTTVIDNMESLNQQQPQQQQPPPPPPQQVESAVGATSQPPSPLNLSLRMPGRDADVDNNNNNYGMLNSSGLNQAGRFNLNGPSPLGTSGRLGVSGRNTFLRGDLNMSGFSRTAGTPMN
jgi:hypothetical protein